jgi:hypothetical protein
MINEKIITVIQEIKTRKLNNFKSSEKDEK